MRVGSSAPWDGRAVDNVNDAPRQSSPVRFQTAAWPTNRTRPMEASSLSRCRAASWDGRQAAQGTTVDTTRVTSAACVADTRRVTSQTRRVRWPASSGVDDNAAIRNSLRCTAMRP